MGEAYNYGLQASLFEKLLMQKQRQKYSRQKGMKANGGHHDYEEQDGEDDIAPQPWYSIIDTRDFQDHNILAVHDLKR